MGITTPASACGRAAWLLPLYDEFLIACKDRSDSYDPVRWKREGHPDPFRAAIVLDERVIGFWRRTLTKRAVAVRCNVRVPVTRTDKQLVAEAAQQYGRFIGLDVTTDL